MKNPYIDKLNSMLGSQPKNKLTPAMKSTGSIMASIKKPKAKKKTKKKKGVKK